MAEDKISTYYNYLKNRGEKLPSEEFFKSTLQDPEKAKTYYDYLRKKGYDVPKNPDSFYKTFSVKKKDGGQELVSSEMGSTSTLLGENDLMGMMEAGQIKQPEPLTLEQEQQLTKPQEPQKPSETQYPEEFIQKSEELLKWGKETQEERDKFIVEQNKILAKQTINRIDELSISINDKQKEATKNYEFLRSQLTRALADQRDYHNSSSGDPNFKENLDEFSRISKDLYSQVQEAEAKERNLRNASELLIKAKKYNKTKDVGVLNSMFNSQYGRDLFSFGVNEMSRNIDMYAAAKKPESERTEEENLALMAYALNEQLMGVTDQKISSIIGSGVAQTVPFLIEFALSGGTATTAKEGTKTFLKELGEAQSKKLVKQAITKLAPVASEAAGIGTRALFLPSQYLPSVPQRMMGNVSLEGEKVVIDEGESFGEAFTKVAASTYLTAGVETLGGPLTKLTTKGKAAFLESTIPGKKIAKITEQVTKKLPTIPGANTAAAKMGKQAFDAMEIQSVFSEFAEEVIEAYGQPAITGDQKLSEVWDNKQMLGVLGTVAMIGGTRSGMDIGFRAAFGQRNIARENLAQASNLIKPETRIEIDKILNGENIEKNGSQMDAYIQSKLDEGATRDDIKNMLDYYSNKIYMNNLDSSLSTIESPLDEKELSQIKESRAQMQEMGEELMDENIKPVNAQEEPLTGNIVEPTKTMTDERIMQVEGKKTQSNEGVSEKVTQEKVDVGIGEKEVLKPEYLPETEIPRKVYSDQSVVADETHVALDKNDAVATSAFKYSPNKAIEYTLREDTKIADVSKPKVVEELKNEAKRFTRKKDIKKLIEDWTPENSINMDPELSKPIHQAAQRLGYHGITKYGEDMTKPILNVWNVEQFEGVNLTHDDLVNRASERSTDTNELYSLFSLEENNYDNMQPWQQDLVDKKIKFTPESLQRLLGVTEKEGNVSGWWAKEEQGLNLEDYENEINNNYPGANVSTQDIIDFMETYPTHQEALNYTPNQSKLAGRYYEVVNKKFGIQEHSKRRKKVQDDFHNFIVDNQLDFDTFDSIEKSLEDNKNQLSKKQYDDFKKEIRQQRETYQRATQGLGLDDVQSVYERNPKAQAQKVGPRIEPQTTKPKSHAKEQQSRQMRVESKQEKVEGVSDKNLSEVNRPELQNRKKSTEQKIADSLTLEELNEVIASGETNIKNKTYLQKKEELVKKGYYTPEDLPENIQKTIGLDEKIESNKEFEDYFKSDPGVKSAGFSFDIDNKKITPDYLYRKYLKQEGLLPKKVYNSWMQRQGNINAHTTQAEFLVTDFQRAIKKAYGKTVFGTPKVSTQQLEQINDILQRLSKDQVNRTDVLSELPEPLREPISKMRDIIDAMSTQLAMSGLIEGDLVAKIQDNLGFYMTRTYKVHSDKKWAWDKIPEDVKIKAAKVIKGEMVINGLNNFIQSLDDIADMNYRNKIAMQFELDENGNTPLRPDQIEEVAKDIAANEKYPQDIRDRMVNYILIDKKDIKAEMQSMIASAGWEGSGKRTLGAKDLGILKARKDIPIEIREFLGEYKDPAYNFITSMYKMANLLENHKFLTQIKNDGMGLWLFSKPQGEFIVQISKSKNKSLAPIDQLYTSEDILSELNKNTPKDISPWLKGYMTVVGWSKYNKTILSPVTHSRNFWSNFIFQLANSRYDIEAGGKSAKASIDMLRSKNDEEFRAYWKKLQELNVIGESLSANEIKKSLKESFLYQSDYSNKGNQNLFRKVINNTGKVSNRLYNIEDDIHKIYAFEVEKKRYAKVYKKQFPTETAKQIEDRAEQQAAKVVRLTMPTYSELPKLVQDMNRFPFAGTFVSFPAEIIRTTFNTARLAQKEILDPNTRTIGISRTMGFLTAAALSGTVALMSRIWMGLDQDDEENIKRFLAPWSKNSDIVMIANKGNGKYTYMDLGFSDPHNYLKKVFNSMQSVTRGKDPKEALYDSLDELLNPFIGTDMLTSRLLDVKANKQSANGRPVYTESDELGDQFIDALNYMLAGFAPGALTTADRINKSIKDQINDFGGSSTPTNEIIGVVAGQKIQTLDLNIAYYFKARESGNMIFTAIEDYKNSLNKSKKGYDIDLKKEVRSANKSLHRHLAEARKDYLAALNLGVPQNELDKVLSRVRYGNYPNRKIGYAIVTGDFPVIDEETGELTSKK